MKTVMYVRANGIYSDSRATKEITSILRAGYQVLIVGWDREGHSEEKCKEVFSKYLKQIKICMFNYQVQDHVGFKNIGKLYKWLRFVANILHKNKDKVDIVHACNLDTILLCYKKCKKYNIKIVYDIFDYYVDGHGSIPSCLRSFIEKLEIGIINTADVTVICTDERREQIAKSSPKKIIVVHNTPEVEWLHNDIEYDYFYCGTFCIQRLIEEIFKKYKDNSDLKFGFAGYGLYKDQAKELDKKYENFKYLGQIMYKDCLINESKSICLSAIYEPTIRNHRLCAPNKFYESLALGKPVIVCRGTGIDKVVEKYNIGIVINYDVNEFYDAVRAFKSNPAMCEEMGKRARNLYDEKYNWGLMEKILLDEYEAMLRKE